MAQAAMGGYKRILWYPNYTTARRGAPADATVIFSDEEVTSPLVSQAQALVVVESSRLKLFEHRVQPGGWIVDGFLVLEVITPRNRGSADRRPNCRRSHCTGPFEGEPCECGRPGKHHASHRGPD